MVSKGVPIEDFGLSRLAYICYTRRKNGIAVVNVSILSKESDQPLAGC